MPGLLSPDLVELVNPTESASRTLPHREVRHWSAPHLGPPAWLCQCSNLVPGLTQEEAIDLKQSRRGGAKETLLIGATFFLLDLLMPRNLLFVHQTCYAVTVLLTSLPPPLCIFIQSKVTVESQKIFPLSRGSVDDF
jgi:hypothetical protein